MNIFENDFIALFCCILVHPIGLLLEVCIQNTVRRVFYALALILEDKQTKIVGELTKRDNTDKLMEPRKRGICSFSSLERFAPDPHQPLPSRRHFFPANSSGNLAFFFQFFIAVAICEGAGKGLKQTKCLAVRNFYRISRTLLTLTA